MVDEMIHTYASGLDGAGGRGLELDPASTALLVVDMQNAFCDEAGSLARSGLDHRPAAAVVPTVASLLAAARNGGAHVVHTRYSLRADHGDAGLLFEVAPALRLPGALVGDDWDAEIVPALTPWPGERVVDKTRYSAFFGTGLAEELRALDVGTVVVCGVTTNVCVEGTARDAFAHDLRVVVVADATAAVDDDLHTSSLRSMAYGIGTLSTAAATVAALTEGARR
ncbi:cysteine hydrolase [Aeromicrobium sp. Leaf245]|uniref:cysteine hydrolase n=2 Tax=unclassified Aeromicrobium TaxID=2633570 RepID=UPI0006F3DB44|nr:cysteine hydrolase [Aeromicrobium sp. Leaf245]KQO36300.1 hypothetical protein ASF05_08905 [Aeromicrobium sp. Leaf245]KQP84189.1 hypothetical protein ASF35_04450 [Aeromicrobium sp. Leaf291]